MLDSLQRRAALREQVPQQPIWISAPEALVQGNRIGVRREYFVLPGAHWTLYSAAGPLPAGQKRQGLAGEFPADQTKHGTAAGQVATKWSVAECLARPTRQCQPRQKRCLKTKATN